MKLSTQEKPFSCTTLAKRWGCSKQTIHNMIERKEIQNTFSVGRMKRIPAFEVERIESCGNQSQDYIEESTMPCGDREQTQKGNPLERQPWTWQGSA